MNCPSCNLEISEVDNICPFCGYTILNIPDDKSTKYEQNENTDAIVDQDIQDTVDEVEQTDIIDEKDQDIIAEEAAEQLDESIEENTDITVNSEDTKQVDDTFTDSEQIETNTNQDYQEKSSCEADPKEDFSESNIDTPQDNVVPDESDVSLIEGHNQKHIHLTKVIELLSGKKIIKDDKCDETVSNKSFRILAAIPFFFWIPYIMKRKSKNTVYFANNSFKLSLFFMFNSFVLLVFELIPFLKTLFYEQRGIIYYATVDHIPIIALAVLSLLTVCWICLVFLNIYCAVHNISNDFLPFKNLKVIK